MPSPALTFRAGPAALALIRERGLRAEDVDVIPAASGGAKWLALAGLDRFLFSTFLQTPRSRPLHLIGSSIGSWRMACLAQRDPVAALERGHHAYIHDQRYTRNPQPREVTAVLTRALDTLLGPAGVEEILAHPSMRLHGITSEGRGLAASDRRPLLWAALALSMSANLLSRRTLSLQWRRSVPHFYSHIVPGWFDKRLRHRHAHGRNFERTLLIAPSDDFVATLPDGRIPDRRDFVKFTDAERIRRWERVVSASERLGDELRELLATGRVAERLRPW